MKIIFEDEYGFPVERISGKYVTNFIRLLIHTKKLRIKTDREIELEESLNDLLNDCINFDGGKLTDRIMVNASNTLNEKTGKAVQFVR